MNFSKKKVLIMGLGTLGGGIGAARFFARRGAHVTVTDSKDRESLKEAVDSLHDYNVIFKLGKHSLTDVINADLIIKNPAVPYDSPYLIKARNNNIPIEMSESLFMKLSPSRDVIGVTGTRGKSTTATLIYEILKKNRSNVLMGGNVRGTSTLELLDDVTKSSIIVLELSSWMLESFGWYGISPRISVITNIFPDHLNRYSSMEEYVNDKKNIYRFQDSDNYLILNRNNEYSRQFAKEAPGRVVWFSEQDLGSGLTLNIPGRHNIQNAAAAGAVCRLYSISESMITRILSSFRGLPFRLETIATIGGVTYINDSASTTPIAGITAIDSFPGRTIILIAGGNSKNIPLSDFVSRINDRVKHTLLFEGTAYEELSRVNKYSGPFKVGEFTKIVNAAHEIAEKGDIVLFSPGVTHLPYYNEFERGRLFNTAVRTLQQQ